MAGERGSQDTYSNDKCPKCGAMYAADSVVVPAPTFPVAPDVEVFCLVCDHAGPIKDWWDAFDKDAQ